MERPPCPPCVLTLYPFSALPDLCQAFSGTSPYCMFAPLADTSQLPHTSSGAPCGASQGPDGGCCWEAHSYLETPGIYIRLSHPGLSSCALHRSMKSESPCPQGWGLWKPKPADNLLHLEIFRAWGLGFIFTFGGLHGCSFLAVCRPGRMQGSHSRPPATRPASCMMLP